MNIHNHSDSLRAYLDRVLAPDAEAAFEEAMLNDPALAEQVSAELALRRGFKALARSEGTGEARTRPHQAGTANPARHAVRAGRPRWMSVAAAAALFALAAVPSWLIIQGRSEQAALEARLSARIDAGGERAAFALPASFIKEAAPAATGTPEPALGVPVDEPVRIRLPEGVSEIALELPVTAQAGERRLVFTRGDDPASRFEVSGAAGDTPGVLGFALATTTLAPGRYDVVLEQQQQGAWVEERRFSLNID